MLTSLIKTLGWLLARLPEWLLRLIAAVLGEAVLWFSPRRRRLIRSNLNHAFPDKPRAWHERMARLCCQRLIETGMLSLATPSLGERRIRKMARLASSVEGWAGATSSQPGPVVFATLHLALWESQTWLKLLSPVPLPEFGIIFRPLDSAAADAYVKKTRERFGMRLLSRHAGFADALKILRNGGCVGVLFDQNAGLQGALTLLLDRVCSSTELPGLMAAKMKAQVRTFYPRRTGFWRVEFESDLVSHDGTAKGITFSLNRWLEKALADDNLCASWLWAHDRWRHQDMPATRLRLESKRNLLDADLAARGLTRLPRRTRVWIRMPNWLGDVVVALPLLRALRKSRPDAEITLIAKPGFKTLLETWGVADQIHSLPAKGAGYFPHFWRLRQAYPDTWILFTQSFRGDLEARLSGCPQRFGILREGKSRPFLTHAFQPGGAFDEGLHHQLELWENFLRHFGLEGPLERTPLAPFTAGSSAPIGLIAGSENNPQKRWPVSHWKTLIEAFPAERFVLFGTPGDATITREIASGFASPRLTDLAGKTDLPAFAQALQTCRLLVTNDTGGMHLANALGVPLIGLFGPTNPVRTGPVFTGPWRLLQPPGCAPTGGRPLAELKPETVISAVRQMTG